MRTSTLSAHRLTRWSPAVLVAAFALLAYWKTFEAGFVWDDYHFLFQEGRWFLEGGDWLTRSMAEFYVFQGDAGDYSTNYFRPLVLIGFVAQMRAGEGNPAVLHGISLGILALNGILVAALTKRWVAKQLTAHTVSNWVAPCAAGVVYVLHPALVESGAWISGQFDLLVTTFTLAALLIDAAVARPYYRAVLVAFCFLLAALCKEAAIVLPLLLAASHWYFGSDTHNGLQRAREVFRLNWRTYVLVIIAGVAYLAIRWTSLGHIFQTNGTAASFSVRSQMFGYAYLEYWRLTFVPFFGLSPLNEVEPAVYLQPDAAQWVRTALSTVAAVAGVVLLKYRRPLGFAISVFTLALLPVLHFLPMLIGLNLHAERFLTLPIAVFLCALAPIIVKWVDSTPPLHSRRWLIGTVTCLWIAGALVTTRSQIPLWNNNLALWTWVTEKSPESTFAANHLLAELVPKGRSEHADALVRKIEATGEIDITSAVTLSSYYANQEEYRKAISLINGVYERSTPGSRMHSAALINFASVSARMGDFAAAKSALRDVLEVSPDSANAHLELVRVLAWEGRRDEALGELPLALSKTSPALRNQTEAELRLLIEQLTHGPD